MVKVNKNFLPCRQSSTPHTYEKVKTGVTTNTMPSRIEVWAQMGVTACLLVGLGVLFMTPGFLSLRLDPGTPQVHTTQQETR